MYKNIFLLMIFFLKKKMKKKSKSIPGIFFTINEACDECWGKTRNPGVLEIIILKLFYPALNLYSALMSSFHACLQCLLPQHALLKHRLVKLTGGQAVTHLMIFSSVVFHTAWAESCVSGGEKCLFCCWGPIWLTKKKKARWNLDSLQWSQRRP